MSIHTTPDQLSYVFSPTKSRKVKSSLLGGAVKWSSNWEFLYRSLAYTFTLETLLCHFREGEWDRESNFFQIFLAYIFVGMPLYYTQVIIGQYAQMGVMCYRNILPIARGLTYTILICSILETFKYGVWVGDSMLYFLTTMQTTLPWMYCPQTYSSRVIDNFTVCFDDRIADKCKENCIGPNVYLSSRYYYLVVFLGIDKTVEYKSIFPAINRIVALCVAWLLVFLFVHYVFLKYKKILMVQLILSCILVLLLCTGTISANGGKAGIRYLFNDLWYSFYLVRPWLGAVAVVIKGLSLGQAFAMTSGAKFSTKSNITLMVLIFAVCRATISIFCSLFYQSIIGMIAQRTKTSLNNTEAFDLRFDFLAFFISVPQGLGYLTVPQVWNMTYFSFCITLLLMNIISRIVTICAVISDVHGFVLKYGKYILAAYCMVALIVGLPMMGQRYYLFGCHLMSGALMLLEIFNVTYMAIMIYCVYGVRKLSDDIQFLTGTPPTKFWKFSWCCLPIITAITFYGEYNYYISVRNPVKDGNFLIIVVALACILPVPIFWIVESISHVKARHLTGMLRPTQSWGPADPEERHKRLTFNPRLQTKYHSRTTACNHQCLIRYKGLRILQQEESRCTENLLSELEEKVDTVGERRRSSVKKTIALNILDEVAT